MSAARVPYDSVKTVRVIWMIDSDCFEHLKEGAP
ncbi:hypothetical protein CFBP3846_01351 [Pseudomonas syringae pv. avii]|uniref:Uncharacterized protein n=2 Tax=Pseudomonas syringae group TaxID=136849 RepID=A0ABY1U3D5_PSESX|nr:hypothetical protein NCPPB2254_01237 [Pseudomonas syringae pv. persicae]SOQ07425.1 hypothetical protein CFBP1573P_01462 [Pseudomonas syringae pv. persicae]SOS25786.1 hypothetical protein CFBP3846_01351 [Pseudomonas syringae pv. avii]